jgi:hypothetical protein
MVVFPYQHRKSQHLISIARKPLHRARRSLDNEGRWGSRSEKSYLANAYIQAHLTTHEEQGGARIRMTSYAP